MIEYILQEKNLINNNIYWFDIYTTTDLDIITKMRMVYKNKYSYKVYRIVSVVIWQDLF